MEQTNKAQAKDLVIQWVRSKNPQTMEYSDTFKVHISNLDGLDRIVTVANEGTMDQIRSNPKIDEVEILGSDMGLQELLIALWRSNKFWSCRMCIGGILAIGTENGDEIEFEPQSNLHNQSEDFYQSILPLLPSSK